MSKIVCFALMVFNKKSRVTRLIGLYDTSSLAESMLRHYLEDTYSNKKFHLYIKSCSFSVRQKLVDCHIISCCYNIANCLELAERAFLKKKYNISKHWFDTAKVRCISTSILLGNEI